MSDTSRAPKWSMADIRTLREAHAAGGRQGARSAFPDRSEAAVYTALRRYLSPESSPDSPPLPIDGRRVRERLFAMPLEVFEDGFAALMQRSGNFHGSPFVEQRLIGRAR